MPLELFSVRSIRPMIDKSNTIRHREFFFFNFITELWYFVHFCFILSLEMIYSYITINVFCQGVILFVFNLIKKSSTYILIYLNMHISVISVSTLKNFRPALGANSKTNKTKQTQCMSWRWISNTVLRVWQHQLNSHKDNYYWFCFF